MKKIKKLDIVFLVLLPIFATLVSFVTNANYLESTFLFFALPSFWLSLRTTKKVIVRTTLFATVFIPFVGLIINYLAFADGSWYVPSTIFPRIFGVLTLEDLFLTFFSVYFLIMCYEHFVDKEKNKPLEKKFILYFITPSIILLAIFLGIYFFHQNYLSIHYFYFFLGIFTVVSPIGITLFLSPKLFSKYLKVFVYFFFVNGLFEYVGASLNYWNFPEQHFLGHMNYFGCVIPIEEFVFFIGLTSVAMVSYYELFDDDIK